MEVIKEGTTYDLSDGSIGYVTGEDGWGLTPIRRLSQRGPQQHGETDVGFRLDPRRGRLVISLPGTSWSDLQTRRGKIVSLFSPGQAVSLQWNRTGTRRIDAHCIGDISFASNDRDGFLQKVVVALTAPEPTFYDPTVGTRTINLGGGSDTFAVPMSVPHTIGASTAQITVNIIYPGTWHSFPHLIRIIGPITNAKIKNNTTGEVLDFTGVTISGGDYYDIDLRYGQKTVVNSSGVNKIADLTDGSDLSTWHLEKGPQPGTLSDPMPNSIKVTGSGITSTTKVEIAYYIRYLGI